MQDEEGEDTTTMFFQKDGFLSAHDVDAATLLRYLVKQNCKMGTYTFTKEDFPWMQSFTFDFMSFLRMVSMCSKGTMDKRCFKGLQLSSMIELLDMGKYVGIAESFFSSLFEAFAVHMDSLHHSLEKCLTAEDRQEIMITEDFKQIDTMIASLLAQYKPKDVSQPLEDHPAYIDFRFWIVKYMGEKTSYTMSILPNGNKLIARIVSEKEERILELTTEKEESEKTRARLEERLRRIVNDLEETKRQVEAQSLEVEVQTRVAVAATKRAKETKTLRDEMKRMASLQAELNSLKKKYDDVSKDRDTIMKENSSLYEKFDDRTGELRDSEEKVIEFQRAYESCKLQLMQLSTEKAELVKSLDQLTARLDRNDTLITTCMGSLVAPRRKRIRSEEDDSDQ